MSRPPRRRVLPRPEIIERPDAPAAWRIEPVTAEQPSATVNVETGILRTSLDDTDAAAWIRRQHMGGLTWSPNVHAVPEHLQPFVQAVEYARINLLLAKHRFSTVTHRTPEELTAHMGKCLKRGPVDALLTRLAMAGTSDEPIAAKALAPREVEAASMALRAVRQRPTYATTEQVAWQLYDLYKGDTRPNKSPGPPQGGGSGGTDARIPRVSLPPLPPMKVAPPSKAPGKGSPGTVHTPRPVAVVMHKPTEDTAINPLQKPVTHSVPWGTMTVKRVPLPRRLGRARGRGKWRPSDSGAHPRRMERWVTDQAVFAAKGRQRSGTILIDASGSMSLSDSAIEKCLRLAPAATIAMYHSGDTLMEGFLVILARRGRRVSTVPQRESRGNVVDGPALRWLATQKSPRVWVSDAIVTGVRDCQTTQLVGEATGICRAFGILRVGAIGEAGRVLGGARRLITTKV